MQTGDEIKQLLSAVASLTQQVAKLTADQAEMLAQIKRQIRSSANTNVVETRRIELNGFHQGEALHQLRGLVGSDIQLPLTRGWAASPDLLVYIYRHVLATRPATIVEIGSGVSTLINALALREIGAGHVYSVDHDAAFGKKTSQLLADNGLLDYATIIHAPLAPWQCSHPTAMGAEWKWYDIGTALDAVAPIDLLIVDGPPELTGENARFPALPHFRARLAENAYVFLDDAIRPAEKAIGEDWAANWQMSLEERPEFEKGLIILQPRRDDAGTAVPSR